MDQVPRVFLVESGIPLTERNLALLDLARAGGPANPHRLHFTVHLPPVHYLRPRTPRAVLL
ncbi:hypothetical protein AB0F52_42490 [Amycolatopsis sp. NPDC024027]|uniref:hypothetical protein n=1 Tax=Amycolatopsis sp. NPDC024027 TaxID=3154327 RepID=UPI0033E201E0